MVEEDVTIVVRERGAKATARNIKQVGTSSRKAKVAVAGLVGALAAFVSIRGVARIGRDAIRAAASFEQFGLRIGALLGSQKEANIALKNFTDLASKTPFAVSQIVEGASALGAAAIGNREKLEELTQTSANLAAVTGLSFREAAGNLQRSLSAGIGAADLFRERGVRALIESIKGIPDATKLTKKELDAAFADLFGEGGIFGKAAEALSNTLGGALSNIGDAATNAQVALGKAFAPAVVNAAKQALIPFLKDLEELIEDNDVAIREFAADIIKFVIPALTNLVRVGLALAQTFIEVRTFVRAASGAFSEFKLDQATRTLKLFEEQAKSGTRALDNPALLRARQDVARLRGEVDGLAGEFARQKKEAEESIAALDKFNEQLGRTEGLVAGLDFSRISGPTPEDVKLPTGVGAKAIRTPEQLSAERKILALTKQLRITSAGRVNVLDAQLERLNQQAVTLREQAILAGDQGLASFGLLEIEGQRRDIALQRLATAKEETAEAAKLRAELAQEVGAQFTEAIKTGGQSAIDDLSAFAEGKMNEAFGAAILDAQDVIADVFSDAFESVDFGSLFEGAGSGLGQAFGAALGVGAGILAKELGGTSASSRNDLVKSAVESSEAVRGVVAGPTSVPVFQVGQQIEEALEGTESRLDKILEAILAQPIGGAGGGAGAPDPFAAALSSTTPSLA